MLEQPDNSSKPKANRQIPRACRIKVFKRCADLTDRAVLAFCVLAAFFRFMNMVLLGLTCFDSRISGDREVRKRLKFLFPWLEK